MATDGNITNVPITARDIRRAFEIPDNSFDLKGRDKASKSSRVKTIDDTLIVPEQDQELYSDVVWVLKKPFLISLAHCGLK